MSVPRIGVGGPVGSGKTALMEQLCRRLREEYEIAAVTNDIYCREDAEFLIRKGALPVERIVGVETGACPHSAVRDDISINVNAVEDLQHASIVTVTDSIDHKIPSISDVPKGRSVKPLRRATYIK